jgi:hypothetical protein
MSCIAVAIGTVAQPASITPPAHMMSSNRNTFMIIPPFPFYLFIPKTDNPAAAK